MAEESGIQALQLFARRLGHYIEGIVSSVSYRLSTSALEGMNDKIKVLTRMAYGY
ncbi:MAG: transposase [Motiliproteus sp.]